MILPFTVLRRLDCMLDSTKETVLVEYADKQKAGINPEPFLLRKAGQSFYLRKTYTLISRDFPLRYGIFSSALIFIHRFTG